MRCHQGLCGGGWGECIVQRCISVGCNSERLRPGHLSSPLISVSVPSPVPGLIPFHLPHFLSSIHLSVNPSNTASRALPFIISYTLYPSRQDGHPARNITRQIGIPPAPKPISSHHPFLISSAGTFPRPVHSNKHSALSSHSPDPHPRLDTAHPFQCLRQQKLGRRL